MISINLLPRDLRKKERTPMVLLLPVLGGVTCVLSAAALAVWSHFVWLAGTTSERESLEQSLAQKRPMLKYETDLLAEEAEFTKRAETITSIASGRILMTRVLDQFADVVTDGDTLGDQGYLVHLNDLSTSPPKANAGAAKRGGSTKPQAKPGGEIAIKGFALADDRPLEKFNFFHARLQGSRLFSENFLDITDPEGRIETFPDDKKPALGWTINQRLTLKDPADAAKERVIRTMAENGSGK